MLAEVRVVLRSGDVSGQTLELRLGLKACVDEIEFSLDGVVHGRRTGGLLSVIEDVCGLGE